MSYKLLLGSHVSMKSPNYLLGAVKDSLSMGQDGFMIYTGPPQNTKRKPISDMKITEGVEEMLKNGLSLDRVFIHAPYIINLANCEKPYVIELAVDFLRKEIDRAIEMGIKTIILHPGSSLKETPENGIKQIASNLNKVLKEDDDIVIALETMAGKGSERGRTFEELAQIIELVKYKSKMGVCLDTCHIHDAGYDIVEDLDNVIEKFDEIIGLDKLKVIHINDSKNIMGAKKDRHANIGFGQIGFEAICNICHHPKFDGILKVLETPFIDGNPPYKEEIENIRARKIINIIEGK